ncbi:MAG: hypothetical protein MRECE_28c030 [Mycoplasmataceae bacterium CE_OT135]|nr:MAG: hypothetical protein MRECE_28c030 [Mycoplasmataceae bacterium CE_OT135]
MPHFHLLLPINRPTIHPKFLQNFSIFLFFPFPSFYFFFFSLKLLNFNHRVSILKRFFLSILLKSA